MDGPTDFHDDLKDSLFLLSCFLLFYLQTVELQNRLANIAEMAILNYTVKE